MTDTFAPSINPSPGGKSRSITPRVLSAGFGDGYRQDGGDGLNAQESKLSLTWIDVDPAVADTIEQFFIDHKGYLMFLWTPPNEGTERKWKAITWTRSSPTAMTEQLTAQFEEVFDI